MKCKLPFFDRPPKLLAPMEPSGVGLVFGLERAHPPLPFFDLVEGRLRRTEELFGVGGTGRAGRPRSNADVYRQWDRLARNLERIRKALPEHLAHLRGLRFPTPLQHERKPVSRNARHRIRRIFGLLRRKSRDVLPNRLPQPICNFREKGVANRVSVLLVYGTEVFDVQVQQGRRDPRANRTGNGPLRLSQKQVLARKARKRIGKALFPVPLGVEGPKDPALACLPGLLVGHLHLAIPAGGGKKASGAGPNFFFGTEPVENALYVLPFGPDIQFPEVLANNLFRGRPENILHARTCLANGSVQRR